MSDDATTDLSFGDTIGVFPNINLASDNQFATLVETVSGTTNLESNGAEQHHIFSQNLTPVKAKQTVSKDQDGEDIPKILLSEPKATQSISITRRFDEEIHYQTQAKDLMKF